MALFDSDRIYSMHSYGSHFFCNVSGSAAVPLPGSLGEMSGHSISDYRNFSFGTGSGDLLDGILSCNRPSGGGS